jgi:predicted CoA-substrate-specific enzyme activase
MIVAGVDVGSLSAEAVILRDGEIIAAEIIGVKPSPVASSTAVMEQALAAAGLSLDDIEHCVSTGYGRDKIPFAERSLSEISCHGKGAHWCHSSIRTIIDIGGQDCKAIRIDDEGDLVDFKMNEKCAAGTGRFMEIIAKVLGVGLAELGQLTLATDKVLPIVNRCSVFAEYEAMFLLAEGKSIAEIGAGVNQAMAQRSFAMAQSFLGGGSGGSGVDNGAITVTGGVAKNVGVIHNLEQLLGREIVRLPVDPQLVGALGAALFASRISTREKEPA